MKESKLTDLIKPYKWSVIGLILLGFATNGLNLLLPKIISKGVDSYITTHEILNSVILQFSLLAFGTFIFAYLQSIAQTYTGEKVARNLRNQIVKKISEQNYNYIQKVTGSKLLTNLTSDVDNVKNFVSGDAVVIISSIFLILGGAILMLMINWKLALAVLAVLPFISISFALVFMKLKTIFKKSQEVIDWMNKIITGSILGSSIVRVLNTNEIENKKFNEANSKAVELGIQIVNSFALTFPIVGFIANFATIIILFLGGHFVIGGNMSIGEFTAFVSYLGIIIFPILMIGFLSSSISQAQASYSRISEVLNAKRTDQNGKVIKDIDGNIEVSGVFLNKNEKNILKDISFNIKSKSRTAIIGPTAAGKTQLINLLIGLISPDKGSIKFDGVDIDKYDEKSFHDQVALVFQDSIMFNLNLRENIAFNKKVNDDDFNRAIQTAELKDFIDNIEDGLNAMVMERGSSLSGGQKQRIMLARALALNPKVLLLDDFTARVDTKTENKILENIRNNYPDLTLISITQKISSIEDFDQIILLMEGEILAKGKHKELIETSPEYIQIFDSQKSTNNYELQT